MTLTDAREGVDYVKFKGVETVMINFILTAIIVLLVALSVGYIIRAKKRGVKCIGCPDGAVCSKNSCGNCSECEKD